MKYSIALKNLPFVPEERQVIYIENEFDERANAIIKKNYEKLRWDFKRANIDFVYLPMFFDDEEIREKVLYYAPYLTSEIMEKIELRSSYLLGYMSHIENKEIIVPSFLYAPTKEGDDWIFQGQTIELIDKEGLAINEWFSNTIYDIEEELTPINHCQFTKLEERELPETSCTTSEPKVEYSSTPNLWDKIKRKGLKFGKCMVEEEDSSDACKNVAEEESLDEIRDEGIRNAFEALEKNVEILRLGGVSLSAIYEFLARYETISHIHITDDLRIFLPDYNNKEVKMPALYKAVYLLFVYHRKNGIVLQRLEEYHHDLLYYYRKTLKKQELTPRQLESINKLESSYNDDGSIHTVLSRIKTAFKNVVDEHLAKHYYIEGSPGQPYKINLDDEYFKWEDDYE